MNLVKLTKIGEILYPQNNTDFLVREVKHPGIFVLSTDITF